MPLTNVVGGVHDENKSSVEESHVVNQVHWVDLQLLVKVDGHRNEDITAKAYKSECLEPRFCRESGRALPLHTPDGRVITYCVD